MQKHELRKDRLNLPRYLAPINVFIFYKWYNMAAAAPIQANPPIAIVSKQAEENIVKEAVALHFEGLAPLHQLIFDFYYSHAPFIEHLPGRVIQVLLPSLGPIDTWALNASRDDCAEGVSLTKSQTGIDIVVVATDNSSKTATTRVQYFSYTRGEVSPDTIVVTENERQVETSARKLASAVAQFYSKQAGQKESSC